MNGEVALVYRVKLCFQKNSSFELVVAEMAFNVGPKGESSDVWFVDKVEDIGGYCGVDPIDETTVNLAPLSVALGGRCRGTNMSFEAKLAENGIEAAAPLAVVGGVVVENDEDVVADVYCLKDRSRTWLGRSCIVELVGGRGGRGMSGGVNHDGNYGQGVGQGRIGGH
jgi:hypothetical protein